MKRTGNQNFYFIQPIDDVRLFLENYWYEENRILQLNTKFNELLKKSERGYYILASSLTPEIVQKIANEKQTYFDFNFDIASPYLILNQELSTLYNVSNATKIQLKTKFNFYNFYYDNFLKRNDIQESDLLNYYVLLAKDIRQNADIENIVTNGLRIDDGNFEKTYSDSYVTQYVNTFEEWRSDFEKLYKEKLKIIAFNPADLPINEDRSSLFPNFINVEFVKEKSGDFSQAFKDTYLNLNILSKNVELGTAEKPNILNFNVLKRNLSSLLLQDKSLNVELKENVEIKFYDYSSWLKDLLKNKENIGAKYLDFQNNKTPCYFIGNLSNQQVPSVDDNLFLFNLMSRVLLGKTNYIVKENFRDFNELLYGKECYTEAIGIKIEKFKTGEGVIQTYYLENNKEDILNFIDTQIKTDQEYTYNFSYYVLAIGNKYSYQYFPSSNNQSATPSNVPVSVIGEQLSPTQQLTVPDNLVSSVASTININTNNMVTAPSSLENKLIDQSLITFSPTINLQDNFIKISEPILSSSRLYMQARDTAATQSVVSTLAQALPPMEQLGIVEPVNDYTSGVILVKNSPLIYIFEIPVLSNDDIFTAPPKKPEVSKPPTAPIVEPIPYKDIKNKIKFNFQRTIDIYLEKFIILEDSDVKLYEDIRNAQDKQPEEDILFGNDNPAQISSDEIIPYKFVENYEVFRIEQKPFTYEDFKNKKYKTLTSDSFIDTLEYNKKYYYLFRAVDEAGYKSNPTVIYEIEIINNSGIIYPMIKVFEFDKTSGVSTNKEFKKYLYINASYNQTLNNSDTTSAYEASPELGIGPKVWNKNYKIRLTSKETGRKIDINFKMEYRTDTNVINAVAAKSPSVRNIRTAEPALATSDGSKPPTGVLRRAYKTNN
jgi:hypothetical protein